MLLLLSVGPKQPRLVTKLGVDPDSRLQSPSLDGECREKELLLKGLRAYDGVWMERTEVQAVKSSRGDHFLFLHCWRLQRQEE